MSDSLLGNTALTPTIEFNEIPTGNLVPGNYAEIDTNYANIGLLSFPARGLAIGQMNTSGRGVAGTIYTIRQKGQAENWFGAGSPLADAVNSWLAANPGIPLDAVGVAAAEGAVAAAGGLLFGGAATTVATQAIGVAGNRVTFTISPGDTPAEMATNCIAAAEAIQNAPNWPVTFATNSTAGKVAITSIVAGATGLEYDIRANPALGDTTVPGVTIAATQMTGGTGVPELTAVLTAIANTWYTDIVCCFTDPAQTLAALQPALISRAGPMNPLDSTVYIGWDGTQGAMAALIGEGVNSQYVVAIGMTNAQQPTWVWAGSLAGVAAFNLMNDPARQLLGLTLPGVIAPAPADRMMYQEQQAQLAEGIATWDVAPDNSVILQRVVTTYTESPLGVLDTSWQDLMTSKVMTRIRYDWTNYLKLIYPRNKLADTGSLAAAYDPNVATPLTLDNAWAARCQLYEKVGWIINSATTAAAATFVRDPNNRNQVDANMPIQVIGNLMINAMQLVLDGRPATR